MIQLLGLREQQKLDIPPEHASVAQALAAIRHAIDTWNEQVPHSSAMTTQLRKATKDKYPRTKSKTARYKSNLKDKPTTGGPKVINATAAQKQMYKSLSNAA
jgi:multidrug resistance efflux pump